MKVSIYELFVVFQQQYVILKERIKYGDSQEDILLLLKDSKEALGIRHVLGSLGYDFLSFERGYWLVFKDKDEYKSLSFDSKNDYGGLIEHHNMEYIIKGEIFARVSVISQLEFREFYLFILAELEKAVQINWSNEVRRIKDGALFFRLKQTFLDGHTKIYLQTIELVIMLYNGGFDKERLNMFLSFSQKIISREEGLILKYFFSNAEWYHRIDIYSFLSFLGINEKHKDLLVLTDILEELYESNADMRGKIRDLLNYGYLSILSQCTFEGDVALFIKIYVKIKTKSRSEQNKRKELKGSMVSWVARNKGLKDANKLCSNKIFNDTNDYDYIIMSGIVLNYGFKKTWKLLKQYDFLYNARVAILVKSCIEEFRREDYTNFDEIFKMIMEMSHDIKGKYTERDMALHDLTNDVLESNKALYMLCRSKVRSTKVKKDLFHNFGRKYLPK